MAQININDKPVVVVRNNFLNNSEVDNQTHNYFYQRFLKFILYVFALIGLTYHSVYITLQYLQYDVTVTMEKQSTKVIPAFTLCDMIPETYLRCNNEARKLLREILKLEEQKRQLYTKWMKANSSDLKRNFS